MPFVFPRVSGLQQLPLTGSPFAPRWRGAIPAARRAVRGSSPWPMTPAGGRRVFSSCFLTH